MFSELTLFLCVLIFASLGVGFFITFIFVWVIKTFSNNKFILTDLTALPKMIKLASIYYNNYQLINK